MGRRCGSAFHGLEHVASDQLIELKKALAFGKTHELTS